jgi:3'-phosphoadenosine 5'-phosphosulfate sulfotransferase (PAPS reductase)/FAD synthetase
MKNLLVSFSGGETSAFMAQWIKKHLQNQYDKVVYVFANTGEENEETLLFVKKCDEYWGLNVIWVEASVNHGERIGTKHNVVSFETASRNGQPFEDVIKKYGIPNQAYPHCTRELKLAPINSFAKDFFNGEKYEVAIGIRSDEADRINVKSKEIGLIYPLINSKMIPATKPMINFFWKQMPFRLDLKGYQGNCKTCWKKADKKLYKIAQESPNSFDFMDRMEEKYGNFFPDSRKQKFIKEGKDFPKQITFFRKNRSAKQIIEESKDWNGNVYDDSSRYSFQLDLLGGDSCEVFSECGA